MVPTGETSTTFLNERGVKIWNANASRKALDGRNLHHYEEGDLGPVYGFQWRHFGAVYKGPDEDYTGKGVDQMSKLLSALKTRPTSRRMVVSAWNPPQLDQIALPLVI